MIAFRTQTMDSTSRDKANQEPGEGRRCTNNLRDEGRGTVRVFASSRPLPVMAPRWTERLSGVGLRLAELLECALQPASLVVAGLFGAEHAGQKFVR